ncbi:MAG: (d)CMP kinase [Planctomycetota bacterium]
MARGGTIVTIDGPAGTGKSTVAREVARRLGFAFLDTGAMYRAVGLAALRREVDLDDVKDLEFAAKHARVEFDWETDPPGVLLNGEPVGHLLRGGDATRAASYVATVPAVRERLVEQQRQIGETFAGAGLVTEGRDQGSVVFPQAAVKVFLFATEDERLRRRVAQLRSRGEVVDEQAVREDMLDRDKRDAGRDVAPLVAADDALQLDSTGLAEDEVVNRIVDEVASCTSAST